MHTLTVFCGNNKYTVEFDGKPAVREVLEQNGFYMPHPCGGNGQCGKCAIKITGEISSPDEREKKFGERLSCRTRLLGDAIVTLYAEKEIIAEGVHDSIRGGKNANSLIGAAVDIGTTTVAMSIYELATGKCLSSVTARNPQSSVAADVIGRISAACGGRLDYLQNAIISCICGLLKKTGYWERIDKWCITGNTTMLYLLAGKKPTSLAAAPFAADFLFGEQTEFLGAPAYLPDCMHAFIGADITCAVLESGMCDKSETALLCDIGTNGEIALWKNGKLYAVSTAAGPVFEGAGISCGCQSIGGAVEHVTLQNGAFCVQTIAHIPAVGLCGSGVINTVACLLDRGIADETGAMKNDAVICENVVFKRQDIRAVQLAKAAVAAGIQTLLVLTDTKEEEVDRFYIAGGFGSHLNINSAVRIGLFPAGLKDKTEVIGNAALKGAAAMLTSEELKEKAHALARCAECIELSGKAEFNEIYIEQMAFPGQTVSDIMLCLAEETGFSHFGLFFADALTFRKEVRDMCSSDRCGSYSTRWTCPPYCGTLKESEENAKRFKCGIILQMTGTMDDDFDIECIKKTEQAVKDKLGAFVERLKEKGIGCLPMSAGSCTVCEKCTCPDLPCRFPEKAFTSMEAYGLMVSDVCEAANVLYSYGQRTITFTTCVLFND